MDTQWMEVRTRTSVPLDTCFLSDPYQLHIHIRLFSLLLVALSFSFVSGTFEGIYEYQLTFFDCITR